LISSDRIISVPGDTFSTRIFAEKNDDEAELNRLRIEVNYTPPPNPFIYPATGYDPVERYKENTTLIYLDTVLTGKQRQSVAFQFTTNTRTTSGRERWTFTAFDAEGKQNSRSFQLKLRNIDSTLTYHRYSVLLPAPTTRYSRSSLALLPGLTFPPNALRSRPENQALVDLAYLPLANGDRALASPNDEQLIRVNSLFSAGNWPSRRVTQLRRSTLDSAGFATSTTTEAFQQAFNGGVLPVVPTRTDPLVARGTTQRVFAFRTADEKYGLIFIQSFPTVPTAAIKMQVRIMK
jgi:hypothetical protein